MVRITRRGLLSSGAAAGILASSGLPLYAAGRRGGLLRAGLAGAGAADSWDSRDHRDAFMMAAAHGAVFDCLTEIAADGSLRGELAESWEANPEATEWTFRLRRDVSFHNGQPFTAADVIASFDRHARPGGASPAWPVVSRIAAMSAPAPDRLVVRLHHPDPDFPILVSDPRLVIYPSEAMDTALRDGIGTGLYRVKRFEPGALLSLHRVKEHFKDGQAGWFDAVLLHAMADPAARQAALTRDAIDVANRLVNPARGAVAHQVTGNQFFALHRPDSAGNPLADARLWRVLRMALDRAALAAHLAPDAARVGRDSPLGPANTTGISGRAASSLDPGAMHRMLAACGTGGLALEIHAPADLGVAPFRQVIGDGPPLTVPPLHLVRHFGRPTEDWSLDVAAGWPGAPGGLATRLRQMRMRRQGNPGPLQTMLQDDAPAIIPVFADYTDTAAQRVARPGVIGNVWELDNARFIERWWMA